jgi:hypothetical protein
MKFIYLLAGTTPRLSALVSFQGAKLSHRFIWSEKHKAHVYENRELDSKEFNGLVDEFYTHNHNECFFKVVPRAIEEEPAKPPHLMATETSPTETIISRDGEPLVRVAVTPPETPSGEPRPLKRLRRLVAS